MTNSIATCPCDDTLLKLSAGLLTVDQEVVVSTHLDTCQDCQNTFNRIATRDRFIDRVADALGDSGDLTLLEDPVISVKPSGDTDLQNEDTIAEHVDQSTHPMSPFADVEKWFEPNDVPLSYGSLGDYDIIDFIGRGGMGVVFLARERSLNRTVAIKVLAPSLAMDRTAHDRFLREARSAASINHANVATVYAVEESAELPFLVMEHVRGIPLSQRLNQSVRLELKELIRIGYQIASGLAAAHAQGIVHRDIKPGNILLEDGTKRACLTDFGLARITTEKPLTQTDMLVGTPGYIAPEVASGGETDHRADLFSLGCVLYVMAVGQTPFSTDSSMQSLRQIVEEEVAPACTIDPGIPEWLNDLIAELLQKNPALRPQSASQVKRMFKQRYRELRDGSATNLSSSSGSRKPARVHDAGVAVPPVVDECPSTLIERRPRSAPFWYAAGGAACLAIVLGIAAALGDRQSGTDNADRSDAHAVRSDAASQTPNSESFALAPATARSQEVQPQAPIIDPESGAVGNSFLVKQDDGGESSFGSLQRALQAADDGATISISGDGPFDSRGIEIHQEDLTIEAAFDCRPVIRLIHDHESPGQLFLTHELLTLRGLELRYELVRPTTASDASDRVDADDDSDRDRSEICLVRTGGEFEAVNCRFVMQPVGSCIVAEESERFELTDSELHSAHGNAFGWEINGFSEAQFQNCVITGNTAFYLNGEAREAELSISESTIVAGCGCWLNVEEIDLAEDEPGLQLNVENSVLDLNDALIVIDSESVEPDELLEQTHWSGERNVFTSPFIAIQDDGDFESLNQPSDNLRLWMNLENVDESGSIFQRVTYARSRSELLMSAFAAAGQQPSTFQLTAADRLTLQLNCLPGAQLEEVGPHATDRE